MGPKVGWGTVSRDLQGGSNSISQIDRVSDVAPAASSVVGRFRKGTMASACLDPRHFGFSQYATVAFQAATLVLELRESESE